MIHVWQPSITRFFLNKAPTESTGCFEGPSIKHTVHPGGEITLFQSTRMVLLHDINPSVHEHDRDSSHPPQHLWFPRLRRQRKFGSNYRLKGMRASTTLQRRTHEVMNEPCIIPHAEFDEELERNNWPSLENHQARACSTHSRGRTVAVA